MTVAREREGQVTGAVLGPLDGDVGEPVMASEVPPGRLTYQVRVLRLKIAAGTCVNGKEISTGERNSVGKSQWNGGPRKGGSVENARRYCDIMDLRLKQS